MPPEPYDLARTLRVLRRGAGDPTCRRETDGTWWRTCRTPHGPATLKITEHVSPADGAVIAGDTWGPGADRTLNALPALLGADDDPVAFVPRHQVVARALRKHAGLRLPRTGVMDSLGPNVLEQRITTGSAHYAWRRLLARYGEQPPGPALHGMRVMPPPQVWRMVPSWEWHRAGVDGARAEAILRACHHAPRLEEAAAMTVPDAPARLPSRPRSPPSNSRWSTWNSSSRTRATS
ncbi:DNA-3-methyladenine glycosylase family protein [Streptomyces sp. NPDC087843]|uniref:DNA-3-methyladenine glycosylase family protein n=1 Tax=Streptomyces sp. NPDC087843 TaxID=3365804 RepID=UPI003818AECB